MDDHHHHHPWKQGCTNRLELEDRWNWCSSSRTRCNRLSLTKESLPPNYCHFPSAKKRWRRVDSSEDAPPPPRSGHSLTSISDNRQIMLGGRNDDNDNNQERQRVLYKDIWMLNALTAQWTQVFPQIRTIHNTQEDSSYWGMEFGPPRYNHSVAQNGDYLIVYGGTTYKQKQLSDLWVLHLPSIQWRRIDPEGPRPPVTTAQPVSFCNGDYFCVVGSANNNENEVELPLVHRLGPLSSKQWFWSVQTTYHGGFWHKRGPNWPMVSLGRRPLRGFRGQAHAKVGSKVWIFGGTEDHSPNHLLYRLDLESYEWSFFYVPHKAPCPRVGHSMTALGRFLVVMGGIVRASDAAMQDHMVDVGPGQDATGALFSVFDCFFFDTENLTWKQHLRTTNDSWPTARSHFGLNVQGDHHLVLFGGNADAHSCLDDTYALEFDLPPPPSSRSDKSRSAGEACRIDRLGADLGQLYQSGMLSDVTLIVGPTGRQFRLHKAILASRCSFFETMFAGPYAESSCNEVPFPDVNADAAHVVLQFLYTGRLDDELLLPESEHISEILVLVDFWDVGPLLELVEDALASAMSRGDVDVMEMISFAKAHNCSRLTLRGLELCKRNWQALQNSPSVVDNVDPDLMAEVHDYVNSLL